MVFISVTIEEASSFSKLIKEVQMQRTTKEPTNTQVAFSITSVVLRTPMIWLDEAKLEARPPPFDSWMSTMRINKTAITTAKITNTEYIFLIF